MDEEMREYRNILIHSGLKSIESYDKSLLTLSGGALAISLVFIEKIIGNTEMDVPTILILAWTCWVTTIIGTLASFYFSHIAMRKTIKQVDDDVIDKERPGGIYSVIISILNAVDGILFNSGVILIMIFVIINMR